MSDTFKLPKGYTLIEEDTEEAVLRAIVNIVEECTENLDNGDDLPLTDLEFLFLNIRAKAVGDIVEPSITCPWTGEPIKQKIDITKIKPKTPKTDSNILFAVRQNGRPMY